MSLKLIAKYSSTGEERYVARALKSKVVIKEKDILAITMLKPFEEDLKKISAASSGVFSAADASSDKLNSSQELFIAVLALVKLYKNGSKSCKSLADVLLQELNDKRQLDLLSSRVYFYYYLTHSSSPSSINNFLLSTIRSTTLKNYPFSLATSINLLLHSYIHSKSYEMADLFIKKVASSFNGGIAQEARFCYYVAKIKAVMLEYSDSHTELVKAIRKAPKNLKAVGFLRAVYKLSIIVQLLIGEIPDRSIFRLDSIRQDLIPYFHITQAVRIGDLTKFQDTIKNFTAQFKKDDTLTLIQRLRHNVIKTGIRMISLSYSRISLRDICLKLQLDSEEDAEYIVAKAIRDGVIDAVLDHNNGYMRSKETIDIYSTKEPKNAFHERISFCLNLHNESVQAMRYPYSTKSKDVAAVDTLREEERILVSEIEMDEDEDF